MHLKGKNIIIWFLRQLCKTTGPFTLNACGTHLVCGGLSLKHYLAAELARILCGLQKLRGN